MEQVTGLAWLTGYVDDQPRIQRGPCDPNGGMHAAFAALVGLERRDRTGVGCLVEAPMFEAALNVAAEPVARVDGLRQRIARDGNRSPAPRRKGCTRAPEPSSGWPFRWPRDEQWRRLAGVIGHPTGGRSGPRRPSRPPPSPRPHRRRDRRLGRAADLAKAVDVLVAAGVPAAPATDPRRASDHPQLVARGFYEQVGACRGRHPTGRRRCRGVPPASTAGSAVPHRCSASTTRRYSADGLGCTDERPENPRSSRRHRPMAEPRALEKAPIMATDLFDRSRSSTSTPISPSRRTCGPRGCPPAVTRRCRTSSASTAVTRGWPTASGSALPATTRWPATTA